MKNWEIISTQPNSTSIYHFVPTWPHVKRFNLNFNGKCDFLVIFGRWGLTGAKFSKMRRKLGINFVFTSLHAKYTTFIQKWKPWLFLGCFRKNGLFFSGCDHLISVCSELHNWMHNMQVLFRKENNFQKNQILTIFGQLFAKMADFIFENGYLIH